ncbi:GNAT family N-acetyltransferase [Micromonospora sp. RTGN7]|uniref:GNAT family N-acetyltransferase n=1 Tax=Micromonospora sp. RTGN7 TaxID=3016526 RepID=UPI0029FF2926|nr:GNAT family N-acetyltransferase [Micromonospora sp. RTGN7]
MPLRAEHDRVLLGRLLGRDPALHAYQLGDLDDFFWPYTSWFRRGEQVALLYHAVVPPTLLAFADAAGRRELAALLAELAPVLPARLYAHLSPGLAPVLDGWFEVVDGGRHVKMALTDRGRLAAAVGEGQPLGAADLPELTELYAAAYPGNWFDPRMLDTGQYVGVRRAGLLVAVAGVHVYSPTWRVAALGNVTTRVGYRGRGLARAAVAALCRRLVGRVDQVTLNVRADNVAAVRLYRGLGFTAVAEYGEYALTARSAVPGG